MLKIIAIVILIVLTIISKVFADYQISKKKAKPKGNTIYYSSSLKITFILITISWLIMLVLAFLFGKEDKTSKLIISGFVLIICMFCLIYLVYICNWKIILKEKKFIYKNFMGKKIEYNYEYLQISYYSNKTKIFRNGIKIIGISGYTENSLLLSDKIIKVNKKNNYTIVIPPNKKEHYFINKNL